MKSDFIKISDDHKAYNTDLFLIPKHYRDSVSGIYIPHGLIINRIQKLAKDIVADYHDDDSVTFLCVLKGGFRFCQDLMRSIEKLNKNPGIPLQVKIEFIRAKSYDLENQGEVMISSQGPALELKGKNVIIVEDCIDTGRTMQKLLSKIKLEEPKTLKCATLLVKRKENTTGYRPDYLGFEIPDVWITGYGGFDYNESFRDMDHIILLNDHGRAKYGPNN